jgi:DNA-binding CsgD family transcriptional regulator
MRSPQHQQLKHQSQPFEPQEKVLWHSANQPITSRHQNVMYQTPWFGHQDAVQTLLNGLSQTRCVNIVGPRAVGKTRLAVMVAQNLVAESFEYIERFLCDPQDPVLPLETTTCLILESINFDTQLADQVQVLLKNHPQLNIICTSCCWSNRNPGMTYTLEALEEETAIQLFNERAQRAIPHWKSTEQAEVAVLCRHLDFLPGLLELAATLLGSIPLHVMITHLESGQPLERMLTKQQRQRFVWGFGAIDLLERHLSPEDWGLLCRISIFEAGFSLESAGYVSELNINGIELLDSLSHLVDWFVLSIDNNSNLGYRLPQNLKNHLRNFQEQNLIINLAFERLLDYCAHVIKSNSVQPPGYVIDLQSLGIDRADLEYILQNLYKNQRYSLLLQFISGLKAQLVRWGFSSTAQNWLNTMLRQGQWDETQRLTLFASLCFFLSWRGAFDDLGRFAMEGIAVANRISDAGAEILFRAYLAQFHAARGNHDANENMQPPGNLQIQPTPNIHSKHSSATEQNRLPNKTPTDSEQNAKMVLQTNDPLFNAQTNLEKADAALMGGDGLNAIRITLTSLQLGEQYHHPTILRAALKRLTDAASLLGKLELVQRCQQTVNMESVYLLLEAFQALINDVVQPVKLDKRDEALVLRLVQGDTNKQIARHVGMTEHGVRNRLSGLYAVYHCHGRAEFVRFVLEHQLISLES